jgi:hypothetical protein
MGWASFWAIFSQAHLVTLLASEQSNKKNNLKQRGYHCQLILAIEFMYVRMCPGGVAWWSSRSPTQQKIPGSNPARV